MNSEIPIHCGSHEHVQQSLMRQEGILEAFRKENSESKEIMARFVGEICAKIDIINEIKITQQSNMRRREDFANQCENKRTEIWVAINKDKADNVQSQSLMNEKLNIELQKLKLEIQDLKIDNDKKVNSDNKKIAIISGLSASLGAFASWFLTWLTKQG